MSAGENYKPVGENCTSAGEKYKSVGESCMSAGVKYKSIGENYKSVGENYKSVGESNTSPGDNYKSVGENCTSTRTIRCPPGRIVCPSELTTVHPEEHYNPRGQCLAEVLRLSICSTH